MQTITASTGVPHVTSAQMRDVYAGILGNKDIVLDVGSRFSISKISENLLRISDGVASLHGCITMIEANKYEDVEIKSGTIGKKRRDIICIRYTCDANTGINEQCDIVVRQGMEIDITEDDIVVGILNDREIRDGAIIYSFPIYEVFVNSIVIEDIIPLFEIASITAETPWKEPTYSSNFQPYSVDNGVMYRRVGQHVEIRGDFSPKKTIVGTGTEYVIGRIDESCAPSSEVREVCQGSGTGIWLFTVKPNGELRFSKFQVGGTFSDATENTRLAAHASYLLG